MSSTCKELGGVGGQTEGGKISSPRSVISRGSDGPAGKKKEKGRFQRARCRERGLLLCLQGIPLGFSATYTSPTLALPQMRDHQDVFATETLRVSPLHAHMRRPDPCFIFAKRVRREPSGEAVTSGQRTNACFRGWLFV